MFRIIDYNSPEYKDSLKLRNSLLRIPLGLSLFDEDLSIEENMMHIAGFIDDKLVSILVLIPSKPSAKMRQVAVEDKFQGKGIGRKMVIYAETWLKSNKFSSVYCHARDIAVPFYKSLDYKIDGNEFVEVGIKHYVMRKNLQP